ncbi:hypothetical protein PR048_028386 [Dryococelus australis]|uniref:Uncharacterized protein n=1 Tax=Dryococelus australis TaxID=614101 RepID=A0ABQ9GIZ8_9NEOP|nr:hypothetical protein PR048_028386 [Dryococelus australis]
MLKQCRHYLYAVDLQLYSSASPNLISSLLKDINNNLKSAHLWYSRNKLKLNIANTQCLLIASRRILNECCRLTFPDIVLTGEIIPLMNNVKTSYAVQHNLYRLKKFLPLRAKLTLVQSLIFPIFYYCDMVYGDITQNLAAKLQRIQNSCVRIWFNLKSCHHMSPYFNKLNWLRLEERRHIHSLTLAYKILSSYMFTTPEYLRTWLKTLEDYHTINTTHKIQVYENSFTVSVARVWNNLSVEVRNSITPTTLKAVLPRRYRCSECFLRGISFPPPLYSSGSPSSPLKTSETLCPLQYPHESMFSLRTSQFAKAESMLNMFARDKHRKAYSTFSLWNKPAFLVLVWHTAEVKVYVSETTWIDQQGSGRGWRDISLLLRETRIHSDNEQCGFAPDTPSSPLTHHTISVFFQTAAKSYISWCSRHLLLPFGQPPNLLYKNFRLLLLQNDTCDTFAPSELRAFGIVEVLPTHHVWAGETMEKCGEEGNNMAHTVPPVVKTLGNVLRTKHHRYRMDWQFYSLNIYIERERERERERATESTYLNPRRYIAFPVRRKPPAYQTSHCKPWNASKEDNSKCILSATLHLQGTREILGDSGPQSTLRFFTRFVKEEVGSIVCCTLSDCLFVTERAALIRERGARPKYKGKTNSSLQLNYCKKWQETFSTMRVIEVSTEHYKNQGAGKMGDSRENTPTNGIVRHDSYMRKTAVTRPEIELNGIVTTENLTGELARLHSTARQFIALRIDVITYVMCVLRPLPGVYASNKHNAYVEADWRH